MVLIEELKKQILKNDIPSRVIFLCEKDTILAEHYVREIATRTDKYIYLTEDPEDLNISSSPFLPEPEFISVLRCDKLKTLSPTFSGYVICGKVDDKLVPEISNLICETPALEEWQLKDYVYSMCEGADITDLDRLFNLFKSDPRRLLHEVDKVHIFSNEERKYTLPAFFRDNIFSDVSTQTIYTLSNALCTRDFNTVQSVLREIDSIDIEPVGLVTVMVNSFRNMLLIQGNPDPSPEKTGIPVKQYYAISRNLGHYTLAQLMFLLKTMDSIDVRLKSGELSTDHIIDYIILTILSVGDK